MTDPHCPDGQHEWHEGRTITRIADGLPTQTFRTFDCERCPAWRNEHVQTPEPQRRSIFDRLRIFGRRRTPASDLPDLIVF
ncbi:hypothetical protein [Micromonospora sp. NPDC005367]|uniref:hypothetical protein n=1 Tax=Micromonospora sp. NPDC005367 TaxID=3155590 RepID=UPI0033BA1E71